MDRRQLWLYRVLFLNLPLLALVMLLSSSAWESLSQVRVNLDSRAAADPLALLLLSDLFGLPSLLDFPPLVLSLLRRQCYY